MNIHKIVITGAGPGISGRGTAAGAVIAAGPVDSSGVIHGCYVTAGTRGSHAVVLQNTGISCPNGDTAIKWDQKGPQGPPGVVGEVYQQNSASFPVGLTPPGVETATVSCPQGYVATDGGYALSGPMGIGGNATEKWIPYDDNATLTGSKPTSWEVGLAETGTPGNAGGNYVLNADVYCAPSS